MENNLQKVLDETGIKKNWLAEKVGVNKNTITNIIKGSDLKLSTAKAIAKAVNRSLEEIWPDSKE